ncbi:MAG: hypothetical protein JNK26_00570 [Candidatus Doudnabacteria bacterium]|nr:hypothetical protein [Candidatus Doudnabacteria bacterium]
MILLYSVIHLVYVAVVTIGWMLFDKRPDFRKYWLITAVIGSVCTIAFDFAGVVIFQFWRYFSSNEWEYIAISFSTYVVATPLFIEVTGYLIRWLAKFRLSFGIKNLNYFTYVGLILFSGLLGLSAVVVTLVQGKGYGWLFFITAFVALLLFSDGVLGLAGKKGVVTLALEGSILSPLAIVLSGLICGMIWEILNTALPLWQFTNVPTENLLGVPLVVFLFWGTLNLAYWTVAELFFSKYKILR